MVQKKQNSAVAIAELNRTGEKQKRSKKPNGYWLIREHVEEEAKKYRTKSEMKLKNNPAFTGMSKLSISDEIFTLGKKSNGYWTVEKCIDAAKKYKSIASFSKGKDKTAYNMLCKLGLIIDATSHMKLNRVNNNYWTFDRCVEEALKYKTRNEFKTLSIGAYDKCHKNKWLTDVCSHMVSGYKTSDCVYVWKVAGHENVYKIGLTKNTIVENRISFVEKSNNIKAENKTSFLIKGNAYQVEQECLTFGERFYGFSGDGYTEFRMLTAVQYQDLINFIQTKV